MKAIMVILLRARLLSSMKITLIQLRGICRIANTLHVVVVWPERSVFDKVNFIIKNSLLESTIMVLENIGLKINGGHT